MNNREKYPWKKWANKRKIVLIKGRDFDCQTHGMIQMIRSWARKNNYIVSVKTKEDRLFVKFEVKSY
jgi:hypothetical protein